MDFWIKFWSVFFFISLAAFTALAVSVTIGGFFNIRSMFRQLSSQHKQQAENPESLLPVASQGGAEMYGETQEVRVYGGIGRLAFFLTNLLMTVIALVVAAGASGEPAAVVFVQVLFFVVALAMVALRFQNIGDSGWWCLMGLVPVVSAVVFIQCVAYPEGYANTRKMDTAGKVVLGLLLGVIVLVVLGVVIAMTK